MSLHAGEGWARSWDRATWLLGPAPRMFQLFLTSRITTMGETMGKGIANSTTEAAAEGTSVLSRC